MKTTMICLLVLLISITSCSNKPKSPNPEDYGVKANTPEEDACVKLIKTVSVPYNDVDRLKHGDSVSLSMTNGNLMIIKNGGNFGQGKAVIK